MISPKTIVIIGNGVASWRVNEELEKKFVDSKLFRIGRDEFAPKCSMRTTSINCLRGTERGISPLGDLIVDSHEEFVSFFESERPGGVEKGFEYQLWDGGDPVCDERWSKRHKVSEVVTRIEGIELAKPLKGVRLPAYLFNPSIFYLWQKRRLKRSEFVQDHVVEVVPEGDGYLVTCQSGLEIFADMLVLCAGYLSHNFMGLVEEERTKDYLSRCKSVRGSFLRFQAPMDVDKSFSVAIDKRHLIFRESDQSILVGSTSENDSSVQVPMKKDLEKIYQEVKGSLKNPSILPPFEAGELVHGIRHKGAKRMPFWGRLGKNCYGVFGLYKNAFSFSFLAAKQLSEQMEEDLFA